MHESSKLDFQKFVLNYLNRDQNLKICDVGSQNINGTYRVYLDHDKWEYTGIDIVPGPNVDLIVKEYDWSNISTASFDVVISGQCMEHVPKPWRWIQEVARITKPGGLVYVTAPNTWKFHEFPVDCWRVWPDGLKALFEDAGIETIESYFTGPDTTGIGRKIFHGSSS